MKNGEQIIVYDNREVEGSTIIADGKIVKIEKLTEPPRYSILLDSGYEIRIYTDKLEEEKEKG